MSKAKQLRDQTSLPLIAAPMFLISTPKMALETCKQGVVGSFPALNQRTSEGFEKWLIEMNQGIEKLKTDNPDKTIAPYAVNLIVHETNGRLLKDFELCVKHKVPIIITSLGAVPELVDKVHAYGGIVLHDVTNAHHAKKAADAGVDGLIAVSAGAGGHGGTRNPVSLVNEIKEIFDGIIILAGSLTSGSDILSAQAMGADFAYMGTRFINTVESDADDEYKKMICDTKAEDIIYTAAISGVPGNFIRQSLEKAGYDIEKLKAMGANTGKLKSLNEEAEAWKNVWSAGQGVSNIKDVLPIATLINNLQKEYAAAQKRMFGLLPANKNNVKPPAPPAAAPKTKKWPGL